jgi:acetoacetyl-CoA synthetase
MEVPIRRILLGQSVKKAANPGAMRNPASLDFFTEFAEKRG